MTADYFNYFQKMEFGVDISIKSNVQAPTAPVSYYTVQWMFCEKHGHAKARSDILVSTWKRREGTSRTHVSEGVMWCVCEVM